VTAAGAGLTALAGLAAVVMLAAACGPHALSHGALPVDRNAPILYVALGDSTVEGIGASRAEATYVGQLHAKLRDLYPNARVLNLGKGGATSDDVVERQLARAVAARPQLVTLSIGPNDIEAGMKPERYDYNIAKILTRLTRESDAVVLVTLIPDMTVTPRFRTSEKRDAIAAAVRRFNDLLATQARLAHADVIDIYTASQREVPAHPELLATDGYHPSDLGYARWAALMWPAVRARITATRTPDETSPM